LFSLQSILTPNKDLIERHSTRGLPLCEGMAAWGGPRGEKENRRTIEQGISNDEGFRWESLPQKQSFLRSFGNFQCSTINAQCSGKEEWPLRLEGAKDREGDGLIS
jgi:hypothetical protein